MKNPFKKFKKETKTSDVAYKIRVGSIREVPLEELVRLIYCDKLGSGEVPILQYCNGYLLYSYVVTANYGNLDRIVVWNIITESYYSVVNDYKRFVFYDDFHKTLEYTDNVLEKNSLSSASCSIPVLQTEDDVTMAILKRIKLKEVLEGN